MVLGSIPAFPHRTQGRWCVERVRGLHNSHLHGGDIRPVTSFQTSQPNVVLIPTWSPSSKKGGATPSKRFIRAKHGHNILVSSRKKLYCLTNSASSISSVKSSMVFRLGMFLTIHVSGVLEIGITDQGNWMHTLREQTLFS